MRTSTKRSNGNGKKAISDSYLERGSQAMDIRVAEESRVSQLGKQDCTAMLYHLVPLARRYKTTKGRSGVYQTVFQERITDLVLRQGEVEWSVKRSFAKLIPDTKMKNDDKGREQYDDLVEVFGQQWVDAHVTEDIRQIPSYKANIRRYVGGIFVDSEETIEAHTEKEYTFTGKGTTMEQLAWTEALGNKIKVEVSDISTRAKEGKKRRGQ